MVEVVIYEPSLAVLDLADDIVRVMSNSLEVEINLIVSLNIVDVRNKHLVKVIKIRN